MALIIEDGTIVAGADSFATAAELVTYATNFGVTIPATQAAQEVLLRRAALQMAAMSWKGDFVEVDQPLSWPRIGVHRGTSGGGGLIWDRRNSAMYSQDVPSDEIPPQIKSGQMALAGEIYADDLVSPETKQGAVTSEKVGPISQTFGEAKSWVSRPAATRQSYAQFGPYLQAANQVGMVRG